MASLYGNRRRTLDPHGRIAQLGEHGPYKAGVAGSSPAPPTTRLHGLAPAGLRGLDDGLEHGDAVERVFGRAGEGRGALDGVGEGFELGALGGLLGIVDHGRLRVHYAGGE